MGADGLRHQLPCRDGRTTSIALIARPLLTNTDLVRFQLWPCALLWAAAKTRRSGRAPGGLISSASRSGRGRRKPLIIRARTQMLGLREDPFATSAFGWCDSLPLKKSFFVRGPSFHLLSSRDFRSVPCCRSDHAAKPTNHVWNSLNALLYPTNHFLCPRSQKCGAAALLTFYPRLLFAAPMVC